MRYQKQQIVECNRTDSVVSCGLPTKTNKTGKHAKCARRTLFAQRSAAALLACLMVLVGIAGPIAVGGGWEAHQAYARSQTYRNTFLCCS